jgi:prepilin peptidase CpaA
MIQQLLPIVALSIAGLYAAWSDVMWRKLPNIFCLAVAATGTAAVAYGGGLSLVTSSLSHAAIALVAGIGLFSIGAIGGGDGKYYAATAAWFPLGAGMRLLLWVSLAGLVLFAMWFVWRRLRGIKVRSRATEDSDKFPYGVAIAAGSVLAAIVPAIAV